MTTTTTLGQNKQNDYCKCGHLKDHHLRQDYVKVDVNDKGQMFAVEDSEILLECQEQVYSEEAHKMLQCGCKI